MEVITFWKYLAESDGSIESITGGLLLLVIFYLWKLKPPKK